MPRLAKGSLGWISTMVLVGISSVRAEVPAVAVLLEPKIPSHGWSRDLPTPVLLKVLAREGIPAVAVSATQLSDPQFFTSQRFPILIMTSGSAYPKNALPALREFRKSGGSLITSGWAFYSAYEKQGESWTAVKNAAPIAHSPEGLGTGIFKVISKKSTVEMSVPENPLGFHSSHPRGEHNRVIWLDGSTLDPADTLIPLLNIRDENGVDRPGAAMVKHGCQSFAGACDLWVGQASNYVDITDRNVTEEILLRGIFKILQDKGLLSDQEYRDHQAALSKHVPIAMLPTKLSYVAETRPWGASFLPKGPPPARVLQVVDVAKLSREERIALTCLQGLVAREQPRIWLNRAHQEKRDKFWLEQHRAGGYIDKYENVEDWAGLFSLYNKAWRGAVIADPNLYRGDLLALNVAMCEDLIVATPELAQRLNIPVKIDLRGRFTSYVQGLQWTQEVYGKQFNRFVCDYMSPTRLDNSVFDYAMQWRAPVLWIAGRGDAYEPGTDVTEELSAVGAIFAQMAPQSTVMGFPGQGELGVGEADGVQLVSRYARGLVCTDSMANLSVTSGVQIHRLVQPPMPALPPLENNKIYIAMVTSDGDNLNCWDAGFFRSYFEHPGYGNVPLSFTMGPELLELAPVVAKWYYDRAAKNSEFICGVAGVTYTAPNFYGDGYEDKSAALRDFFQCTSQAMEAMGMRSLNMTPGGRALMLPYSKGLPLCHSMIYGWTREPGVKFSEMAYRVESGMPGFDSAVVTRAPDHQETLAKDKFAPGKYVVADLEKLPRTNQPLFLSMIMENWSYNMNNLDYIGKNAPRDVVFVTPAQLAALYRQAAGH